MNHNEYKTPSGMSRRHFIVVDTGDTLELVDLGSSNGTMVNQNVTRRAMLKSGDFIEAGNTGKARGVAFTLVLPAG